MHSFDACVLFAKVINDYFSFSGSWTRNFLVSRLKEFPSIEFVLILCFAFLVKLNGGRYVTGILRGFDPFMNIVVDESIEETKEGHKKNIGMVVSYQSI